MLFRSQAGKRIELDDNVKGEPVLKKGLIGRITGVDDTGQIHVKWYKDEKAFINDDSKGIVSTLAVSKEYGDEFTITESKEIKKFGEYIKEEFGGEVYNYGSHYSIMHELGEIEELNEEGDFDEKGSAREFLEDTIKFCQRLLKNR